MDAAGWAAKWALGGVAVGAGAATYAQLSHYTHARRAVLGDQTPFLHNARVRHCVVLLRTKGGDVSDAMRALYYAAKAGGAGLVYAGRARQTVLVSEQLPKEWDGYMVLQFRSHDHATEVRGSAAYAAVLATCAATYHLEFAPLLAIKFAHPLLLLAQRARQSLKRERILPFTPASPKQLQEGILGGNGPPGYPAKIDDIDYRDQSILDNEPAVQLNLFHHETVLNKKKDAIYGRGMDKVLSAARTGVVCYGRATWWEGKGDGVQWDEVAIVHYPSRRFFMEMLTSAYWNEICRNKKMRDTILLASTPCKL